MLIQPANDGHFPLTFFKNLNLKRNRKVIESGNKVFGS